MTSQKRAVVRVLAAAAGIAWGGMCLGQTLTAARPGGLFVEGENVTFSGPAIVSNACWTLRDWRGEFVRRGTCTRGGELDLDRAHLGYFRLSVGTNEATYAVVRKEPCRNPNSSIATDSAFSGCSARGTYACPWYTGDTYRVTAELMGRCGLVHTRERTFWAPMNPKLGVFDFSRYLANAKLLKRNGLIAEGMMHGSPGWTGGGARNLPTDFKALYDFMVAAVPVFAPYYDSWEYWNEPELGSTRESVWEYAAAYKAFALGCRAASANTVILTGSLSDIDRDGYATALFDNGIAKYADALNIHTYEPPVALPAWHRRIRNYLAYGKVPHWQVWLTEAGTNLEGHGGRNSVRKGLKAHTREQELVMAEFAPKFQILHRFGGIVRTWAFLFGCYNERGGEKDWGTMRRDGSVKPIVAALATAASELGDAEMVGEKKVGVGLRAFAYRRADGTGVLAFWSVSDVDTRPNDPVSPTPELTRTFDLSVPDGAYRLADVMGAPCEVRSAGGRLHLAASRYPQYLSGLANLAADVPAADVGELRRYVAAQDEDLTVVLRPVVDARDFALSGRKSVAELLKENGRLRLDVWNLSNEPKRGSLEVSGGALKGLPNPLALSPWGCTRLDLVYEPPQGEETRFTLKIGGVFNARRVTPAAVALRHRFRFMAQMTHTDLPGANEPAAWRRNDNADTFALVRDEAERAVRFDVAWKPGKGKWFYPVYTLPKGVSLKGAAAIEFEVKAVQDKVENDCDGAYLMVVRPNDAVSHIWLPCAAPTTTWERRLVWLPPEAADALAVRVGCNPRGRRLGFWIRNMRLLRHAGKK